MGHAVDVFYVIDDLWERTGARQPVDLIAGSKGRAYQRRFSYRGVFSKASKVEVPNRNGRGLRSLVASDG
jgi:hypothetical protein